CTSTHQVPASGSVTSQNSFEPGVVLEQTTAAGLGSEPVPTNRSMSLAVESVSETTNREASSGTSITAVWLPLPSKGSEFVESSSMDSSSSAAGTRPATDVVRSVISMASIGTDSWEPASRRVSMTMLPGRTPVEGSTASGKCASGAVEPSGGVSTTLPNWYASVLASATSAVMVSSTSSPSAMVNVEGSTETVTPSVRFSAVTVHVPSPVDVPVTVRVNVQACRHWLFAMLGMFSALTSPPWAGSAAM